MKHPDDEIFLRGANLEEANLSNADMRGVDLCGSNLMTANLRGANLAGSKLACANLSGADFREANLSGSNLLGADLRGADLRKANLYKANLIDANLNKAILEQACLDGADLSEALLTRTYLRDASFADVELGFTAFSLTSLKTVKGLETCRHTTTSAIDYFTLLDSGPLPEVFLRGCGLPDAYIRYLPSLWNQAIEFYSCFISYSHEDKAFAILLHDRLQGQGIRCWLDEHQLLPGDDLHESIDRGIRLWDKVLLCASQASLTSWWVDGEINRAFQKEAQIMKERGKKVLALIPLNLDGFLFSADYQRGKKAEITSRVAANFVGWEKDHALFDRELEKVIRALRTGEGGREKPPPLKL